MSGVVVVFTTVVAFPAIMEIFKQRMAVLLGPSAEVDVMSILDAFNLAV